MHRRAFLTLGLACAGSTLLASAAAAGVPKSLFLEDLTWTELRDAIGNGYIAAIIPTGGVEQNGPHMALGKHDIIVRYTASEIARRAGSTMVAPVISYVPEGRFSPPDGHMAFPGTLGVSDATFRALLQDTATSLALAGFRLICFLGDHGGSQPVQERLASALERAWQRRGIRVRNLSAYYAQNGQEDWLKARGFSSAAIGAHAGLLDTAELMALAPGDVRENLLAPKAWPSGKTGVDGDPSLATAEIGRELLELKIAAGVAELRKNMAAMRNGGGG